MRTSGPLQFLQYFSSDNDNIAMTKMFVPFQGFNPIFYTNISPHYKVCTNRYQCLRNLKVLRCSDASGYYDRFVQWTVQRFCYTNYFHLCMNHPNIEFISGCFLLMQKYNNFLVVCVLIIMHRLARRRLHNVIPIIRFAYWGLHLMTTPVTNR